jgi:hypothetical protein
MNQKMIKKIFKKMEFEEHPDGSGSYMQNPMQFSQLIEAELVLGLYADGKIRVLKDRHNGKTHDLYSSASIDDTIELSSLMIANCVFGENQIKMFSQGLANEITKAVKETIENYHNKER